MKFWQRHRAELFALLLAGCGGAPALPPPAEPVLPAVEEALVLDEEVILTLAALLRMEDERALDLARTGRLLADPNPLIRSRTVLAIGRVRERSLTPMVVGALSDATPGVRADAAFALGLLADSGTAAVQSLITLLGDEAADPRAGIEAAAALARIGTGDAIDALLAAVRPDSARPSLRAPAREALLQLWRAPRDPQVIAAVKPWLGFADADVRWNAAYALARPGGALAVEPLLPLAADTVPAIRSLALRALRAPAADSADLRADAVAALRDALDDPHPHVRINALGALSTYRLTEDAVTVAALLDDADGNVRVAAAQALGEIGGSIASERLHALTMDAATPLGLRATALTALARVSPERARDVAVAWAGSPEWLRRLHATRTLAALPAATPATAPLLERARDPDPRVAVAALRAVAGRDTSAGTQALLIERLASGDAAVRAAAVNALALHPHGADLALLMEAYERARHDTVPAAALAVIDALAGLEERGVPAARSFFLRFPAHPDARVHRRVAERLGDQAWGPPPEVTRPTRPDSFYIGIVRTLMVPALLGEARPNVVIGTARGDIVLALAPEHAPLTVHNFLSLIRAEYYVGDDYGGGPALRWHRVVPNFVLQDGDPRGDGGGGPGYAIRDELSRLRYTRGVLGMALSGPDTGGGQFFITHSPQPHLDAGFTIFGRVIDGMDVADRIIQDDPIHSIREIG